MCEMNTTKQVCGCGCENIATHHVHGYAECGEDGNFVWTPVCLIHKREFDEWDGWPYLHGYAYLTDIHPIGEPCPVD
mgnify:CR=1 FL=1